MNAFRILRGRDAEAFLITLVRKKLTFIRSRGMRRKKIVSIILAAALTVSQAAVPAFADTRADIAAAEASKNEAQSSLDEAQSNISSLQTEKTELETYLNELNTQLTQLSTDLSTINDSMIDKQVEIEITQVAVERARTDEQSQYNAMKTRIKYLYENGSTDFFTTLLEAKSFTELLNKASQIIEMTTYDRKKLNDYKEAKAVVEEQEATLVAEQESLAALKAEHETRKTEVENLVATTDENIAQYAQNISAEELAASNLTTKIEEQKNLLAGLQGQLAAEEAARQQAEQAAAQAAAYAAQQAAEQEAREQQAAVAAAAQQAAEAAQQQAAAEAAAAQQAAAEAAAAQQAAEAAATQQAAEAAAAQQAAAEAAAAQQAAAEAAVAQAAAEAAAAQAAAEEAARQQAEQQSSSGGTYLGTFKITAYCNCAKCNGVAGRATASGRMPVSNHTVAMGGVPFGTQLLIFGTVYTVDDRGTPYGHVDIFFDTHAEALAFGLTYADVYQVG